MHVHFLTFQRYKQTIIIIFNNYINIAFDINIDIDNIDFHIDHMLLSIKIILTCDCPVRVYLDLFAPNFVEGGNSTLVFYVTWIPCVGCVRKHKFKG